ncbi:DUF3618 domain-containing protein [Tessaracoccus lubricantis]|uniref:DUF3618 domain-containing protein n=1 Tax=Tessaracoccus lubricantis TaxID=545543 RepID=A0ABP9EXX1_9ACTN
MTDNPEQIRRDIERTRTDLSNNVNALADSANPARVAQRQVDKLKGKGRGFKERVFGSPYDPYDEGVMGDAKDRVGDARDSVQHAVDDAAHAVQEAPHELRRRTQGSNPLSAGLIAFGLGALVGGLIPSSRREQELASQAKDKAQPLVEEAKKMGQEAVEHLKPSAQLAADSVKYAAQEGTEHVKGDAQHAVDEVKGQTQQSVDEVRADDRNPL